MYMIQAHTLDEPVRDITHQLAPHFEAIKRYPSFKTLRASALYEKLGGEIKRVANGIAWRNTVHASDAPEHIRVTAWNIERGLKLDGIIHLLKTHPVLSKTDILLITEADIGMGRSDNRNIPFELADALHMNVVFANSFLALEKGDLGEQHHDAPNTLALHGICILSRFRIPSCKIVSLPNFKDLFNDIEKRFGSRKGLICTIPIGHHTFDIAVAHIELSTTAAQRGQQMDILLQALSQSTADAILLGGDFNTTTYNLLNKRRLFAHLCYKAFWGVPRVVRHYMTPEKHFEKPIFDAIRRHGFDIAPYNDRQAGTLYYDINDPKIEAKIRHYRIPAFVLRWLRRKLEPWHGRVPLRLDWFTGKHCRVVSQPQGLYAPPQVVDTPLWNHAPVSDHSPIVVDLDLR